MKHLLDQREAAELLGISPRTLERHRVAGTGPRFSRIGRLVRYRQCDLATFVELNLRGSTSEVLPTSDQVRS
jgi:predicted DNA-binding transcriptional regulator AlpA